MKRQKQADTRLVRPNNPVKQSLIGSRQRGGAFSLEKGKRGYDRKAVRIADRRAAIKGEF